MTTEEKRDALHLPEWTQLEDIGLYMDQVILLTQRTFAGVLPAGEITRSMVNNYVKVRLLPRPEGKKYMRTHLALINMIVVLKQALSMEEIALVLNLLCRDGEQAGYERFAAEAARVMRGDAQAAVSEDEAVGESIEAALSVIRAKRAIDRLKEEKVSTR